MGFISSGTTINLNAKLTTLGREKLVSTNNSLITSFSLGDSDANYYATYPLNSGEVPSDGGNIGVNSTNSNGVTTNVRIKSFLVVNRNGITKKQVETQSTNIITEVIPNGLTTISGSNLTRNYIDRNNFNIDSKVNLFYSFGLPLNTTTDTLFTGTTFVNCGYSDTAYSAIAKTKIIVMAIDNSQYGEMIDGKSINLTIPTSAGTYSIYSTFQKKGISLNIEDNNLNDTSVNATAIENNIAFLFCDTIKKPNGDPTLSWSSGWNTHKQFSLNGKQLFNFQTNSNLGLTADTIVGIAYLDKGIIVITDPTIINNFGSITSGMTTGSTLTYDSVSTAVYQNITCIADRGEFGASTNSTIGSGDNPRISEVGLYDNLGNLIAIAKTDRHIIKNVNEFIAIGVKISL